MCHRIQKRAFSSVDTNPHRQRGEKMSFSKKYPLKTQGGATQVWIQRRCKTAPHQLQLFICHYFQLKASPCSSSPSSLPCPSFLSLKLFSANYLFSLRISSSSSFINSKLITFCFFVCLFIQRELLIQSVSAPPSLNTTNLDSHSPRRAQTSSHFHSQLNSQQCCSATSVTLNALLKDDNISRQGFIFFALSFFLFPSSCWRKPL